MRDDGDVAPPLAVVARVGRREEVVATSHGVEAVGLSVGMAATHARARVADLEVRPADPEAERALLDRLALHATRHWTPVAAPSGDDGVWLDLTGCAHLHGGEDRFARRVVEFCRRAGFTARIAVADTPGCAHAVARFGRRAVQVVPAGWTSEVLDALPVAAPRLDAEALSAARRFGFQRV